MNIRYILLIATILLAASCDDKLDISPQQSVIEDQAFKNKLTTQGAVMGVYSWLQDYDVYGSLPQVISDFQADNVNFVGTFPTLQDIRRYATLSTNSSIQTLYRDHYFTVVAANAVVLNAPHVDDPNLSDEEKAQYVAEAKFVRALIYFQLVNLFAHPYQIANGTNDGVPIVTSVFDPNEPIVFPSRSSVNDVHEFIRTELVSIIDDLPENYSAAIETRGRATKGAARALLSRLHLYRGEWDAAADYAEEVINDSDNYSLAGNYAFYNGNTSEDIFSVQNSATDNGATGSGGWASYYMPADMNGRGDARVSQDLIDAFNEEPQDLRFKNLVFEYKGNYYTSKFPDATTDSDNAPVLRVTEMYLNRAEALVKDTETIHPEALSLINDLRQRANLDPFNASDFADADEFAEAILVERRKELAFEGHRRMDLLRNGKALRPATDQYYESSLTGENKTILPIPQRERDVNNNLSQNNGYGG